MVMAENSNIEWTDHTFNPWTGCTKVSPGCDHCYAEGWSKRSGHVEWGPHGARRRTTAVNWKMPLKWNIEAQASGIRRRVFCASLADVFDNHSSILLEWRKDLFDLIAATPHLDWLLLTKRPQNITKMLPLTWGTGWTNVWLGTTAENQAEADRRTAHLARIPAKVRFLSMEPLLERIAPNLDGIHWVIVGGESGPHARPMHPDWARCLRDQCQAAGVAFHFKQWGEWRGVEIGTAESWPDHQRHEWPDGRVSVRKGKKAAGRSLDGRTWDQMPKGGKVGEW